MSDIATESIYRKVFSLFWTDEKIVPMPVEMKTVILYCLTSSQTNRVGIFHFSVGKAAEDIGMLPETFGVTFREGLRNLSWKFDETLRVLYIPSWWTYNPPQNQNVLKGCLKDLSTLPKTALLCDFWNNVETLPQTLHQTFRERIPKPYRIQEQEQEQEQEKVFKPPIVPLGNPSANVTPNVTPNVSGTLPQTFEKPLADVGGESETVQLDETQVLDFDPNQFFDFFWGLFPREVVNDQHRDVAKHIFVGEVETVKQAHLLLDRAGDYVAATQKRGQLPCNPLKFLKQRRWKEEQPHQPSIRPARAVRGAVSDFSGKTQVVQ